MSGTSHLGSRDIDAQAPQQPATTLIRKIVHFPLVLLAAGLGAVAAAGYLAARLSAWADVGTNGWFAVLLALAIAALVGAAYVAHVRWVEERPVDELGLKGAAPELGAGILIGLVLFSSVVAVIAALGGYRVIGTHGPEVLLPALAIAITSGVTEEIVLRGLFFRLIEAWLGSWIALALSAALFGALHLGNPNASLLAGAAIALEAGVMLAALYMVTRRLWAAIGLHAAWNFAQGGIFGIPVSGFAMDGLLRPRIAGPDLLTGGGFGAEASLPAVILCTGFGVALLVLAHRRGRFVAPFWARRTADQGTGLHE